MNRLFNIDSPLMSFLGRITDLLILNSLWIICCIPIVTIVPSTIALYYVTLKMVRNEDSGTVKSFFHSFKDNLKQGIPLTFLFLGVAAILYIDYAFSLLISGVVGWVLQVAVYIPIILSFMIFFYAIPLQAQFENTLIRTLKNAFLLSVRHLLRTILILFLNSLPLLAVLLPAKIFQLSLPFWIFLAPAVIALLCSVQFNKIFEPFITKLAEEALN